MLLLKIWSDHFSVPVESQNITTSVHRPFLFIRQVTHRQEQTQQVCHFFFVFPNIFFLPSLNTGFISNLSQSFQYSFSHVLLQLFMVRVCVHACVYVWEQHVLPVGPSSSSCAQWWWWLWFLSPLLKKKGKVNYDGRASNFHWLVV